MKNCLILGSGRSGTSMVAGCMHGAGYWMGADLMPPMPGNPRGYFESRVIERVNEDILATVVPQRPKGRFERFFRSRPRFAQRWLARVPLETVITATPELQQRIAEALTTEPFCFKDPRFSYTLPVWRPALKDTVFICVFREPGRTVRSILKECRTDNYLKDFRISERRAFDVWRLQYEHVLRIHRREGEWLFVHYNQVLGGDGLDRLEAFLDAKLDRTFPDQALQRSDPIERVPRAVERAYGELCELAGYEVRT